VEAGSEARQGSFEVFANLTVERGTFAHQVAAMADDELQGGPGLVPCGLQQRATGDRSAVDRVQVGIVGLVARVDRLAILLGDEGVHNARLEISAGEAALDDAVITARAFDGHEAIAEVVASEGALDLSDGVREAVLVMLDDGGWNEHSSIEVR